MYHIVVSDHLMPMGWEKLRELEGVQLSGPFSSRNELLEAVTDADGLIVRSSTAVDEQLLDRAQKLKIITKAGALLENVDIDAATLRGIMVGHVPDANVISLAEHTMAMMLTLARHLHKGYASLQAGRWERHQIQGNLLNGKVLGVIGYGRHGKAVAKRAIAFGMRVLSYDPYVDITAAREGGVELVGLDELLETADILTLHTHFGPSTHHLIDAELLASCKEGAWLINCTHAGLVDEDALLDALNSGKIGRAALDTIKEEPPSSDHPLVRHANVLVVPHLNQNTQESQDATSLQAAEQVIDALTGADIKHIVNLPFNDENEYGRLKHYLMLAEKIGQLQRQLAPGPIERIELQIQGEGLENIVRPIATALLYGLHKHDPSLSSVTLVNAPVLSHRQGIKISQVQGLELMDYPNLISCRAHWQDGSCLIAGVLFAGKSAHMVQYNQFQVGVPMSGTLLFLSNQDVPGVIGQVGTLLGQHQVNIGEWRQGRDVESGYSISFISLDHDVPSEVIAELEEIEEINRAIVLQVE